MKLRGLAVLVLAGVVPLVYADPPAAKPATKPAATRAAGKMPHVTIDAKKKEVRVDCTAVKAEYPLEFLAVATHANDYEAVVCSEAKPSDVHLALLVIGLVPGTPVRYTEATNTWSPPTGPAVDIAFEYQKDGKTVRDPAYRWMKDVKTKKEAPPMTWVFTGSRMLDDNQYGADLSNCMVGVINNSLSMIDVPALKSGALEAREYERNADLMPPTATPVTMIISPAAVDQSTTQPTTRETTRPAATTRPTPAAARSSPDTGPGRPG